MKAHEIDFNQNPKNMNYSDGDVFYSISNYLNEIEGNFDDLTPTEIKSLLMLASDACSVRAIRMGSE